MKGERNRCLSLLLRGSPVISPCGVESAAQPAPDPMEWLYSLHRIWQPMSLEKHLQGSDCKQRGCLHCKWITNVGPGRGTFYCGTCFLHTTDGCHLGSKDSAVPQRERKVLYLWSVSTVWAKALGPNLHENSHFKNFRDQVCGLFQGFYCR